LLKTEGKGKKEPGTLRGKEKKAQGWGEEVSEGSGVKDPKRGRTTNGLKLVSGLRRGGGTTRAPSPGRQDYRKGGEKEKIRKKRGEKTIISLFVGVRGCRHSVWEKPKTPHQN